MTVRRLPLPADIARCLNDKCPVRRTCARAEINNNPRQVYATFDHPNAEFGCEFYIEDPSA